jgi:CRISPR-associated protein Cas5t
VRGCFCNPKFALTLGNSDDLLKIKHIGAVIDASEERCSTFENTMLSGDHTVDYQPDFDLKNAKITYRVVSPQVFLLPTAFNFKDEERRVGKREQFTFVGSPIRLKTSLNVYNVEDILFSLL